MSHSVKVGVADIITTLRQLTTEHGARLRPILRARRAEELIDWSFLTRCSNCRRFSLNRGQLSECRYPTDGVEGLHVQFFRDWIDFHLDRYDACDHPVAHLVTDTLALRGWLVGTCAGLLTGRASVGAAGGIIGACAGSMWPRGTELIVFFEDLEISTTQSTTVFSRSPK